MEELKGCPACDFEGMVINILACGGNQIYFQVRCLSCNRNTKIFPTRQEAIDAWNTGSLDI